MTSQNSKTVTFWYEYQFHFSSIWTEKQKNQEAYLFRFLQGKNETIRRQRTWSLWALWVTSVCKFNTFFVLKIQKNPSFFFICDLSFQWSRIWIVLIMWLIKHWSCGYNALITWLRTHWKYGWPHTDTSLITHWSCDWSCTDHVADHTLLTWLIMH